MAHHARPYRPKQRQRGVEQGGVDLPHALGVDRDVGLFGDVKDLHAQSIGVAAVCAQEGAAHAAVLVGGAHHDGTRCVSEQHGHGAAARGEVQRRGVHFCADQEHVLLCAGLDQCDGGAQPVEKTRALVADVHAGDEATCVAQAELLLQDDAGAGKEAVRRQRTKDDHADVGLAQTGTLDGLDARLEREVGAAHSLVGVVALLDA
ncbi:MAG: hypothetical protein RLZZ450_2583 [Pseudomonadota bacterium]